MIRLISIGLVCAGGVVASTESAGAAARIKGIEITGASAPVASSVCGATHPTYGLPVGGSALVRATPGRRRATRHAVLKLQQCEDGTWATLKTTRIFRKRAIPSGTDRDLRIAGRGKTRYVRVGTGPIDEIPISFQVQNIDRTPVSCPVDGRTYTVRGHLTARAAYLEPGGKDHVTLYDHGHSFSEEEWRYQAVPGYDFVGAMAQDGHVSVTYDRLGYESSDKPPGHQSCYASEADIVHQIVGKLRAGDYATTGLATPPKYAKVALAGHSQASIINETEIGTFHDVDALLHFSFVSAFLSASLGVNFANNLADCQATDTAHANNDPSAPTGYAYRGRTDADFQATNFYNADPAVAADLTKKRNVDPCGFPETVVEDVGVNQTTDPSVTVPVLVTLGANDPNFDTPAAALAYQGALYSGSSDVTTDLLPDTGHAVMFERTAPAFQRLVSAWLTKHGF